MNPRLLLLFSLATAFLFSCGNEKEPAEKKDTAKHDTLTALPKDTSTVDHVTFHIATLERPKQLLPEHDARFAFEARLGKKIYAFPEMQQNDRYVCTNMNGFLQAIHESYASHRPFILSPDEVWLTLCQGFSIHVNEHFDSLKTQLFVNEKPEEILVRNDSLGNGSSSGWQKLIVDLAAGTKQYVKKDIYGTVVRNFSTTGPTEKTAFAITLLESQKKAFTYAGETGCGIPKLTLKGKKSDWQQLDSSLENFRSFGLGHWIDNLHPLLAKFIETYDGKIDTAFWDEMYKYRAMYGATAVSGWIVKFFPYIKKSSVQFVPGNDYGIETFRYEPNPYLEGEDYHLSLLDPGNFPSGYARIDVKWSDYFSEKDGAPDVKAMEVYAGFFALRQDAATQALEPVISWAVCYRNAAKVTNDEFLKEANVPHPHDDWSFEGFKQVSKRPVYHPAANKDFQAGMEELKNYLSDTLRRIPAFTAYGKAVSVQFYVTWSGTVARVETVSKDAAALQQNVASILTHLPYSWSPPQNYMDDFETDQKKWFRVNYQVSMKIDP